MRLLSFVVGSILISGLLAEVKEDIEICRDSNFNMEDLENLEMRDNLPSAQEIETLCPMILGFMECAEKALEKELGMTVEEIAEAIPEPVVQNAVTFYINIRSITKDICTEGSDLNRAYTEHGSCLSTVDLDDEVCENNAITAYETYKGLENSLEEETDEDLEKDCLMSAYMSACLASLIHEKCGQDAFNFYQQVVKRSSFFRLALCSEKDLENMKTKFLNSLELEEGRHELFGLAFDLRKRRK